MSGDMKLELVQILFRHGARTCIKFETMVMENYIDQTLHDTYGYEQLTNYGKAQMYKLGRTLRARYDDFLDANYHPRNVCARSTDIDRTKMSLQLVLAGLYPPSEEQSFVENLNWMPLPFSTVPIKLDCLLFTFDRPKYRTLLGHVRKAVLNIGGSPESVKIKQFFETRNPDLVKLAEFGALGCYNFLNSHKTAKCPLPDWFSDDIYDSLRDYMVRYLDSMSSTVELKKILSGPLVKKVIENMNLSGKMNNPRKIYLYSAHEFNVAGFLRAHKVEDMKYPDFGSAVVVEKLRDKDGQLYVRMLTWTGKDDDFCTVKLNNRDELCPIDEYLKIVQEILPSDEELETMYKECIVDIRKINSTDPVFEPNYIP